MPSFAHRAALSIIHSSSWFDCWMPAFFLHMEAGAGGQGRWLVAEELAGREAQWEEELDDTAPQNTKLYHSSRPSSCRISTA